MADDLVTRLRCIYVDDGCGQCTFCLAKAEIERLRSLIKEYVAVHVATLDDTYIDSYADVDARSEAVWAALQKEARRG